MAVLPENEKWVIGSEGIYSVSYEGEIYSYRDNKKVQLKGGTNRCKKTNVVKIRQACLSINGKPTTVNYQKVVADAWIPNPESKPNIFHKDFDKRNNCVDNLVRVTAQEQAALVYATKKTDIRESRKINKGFGEENDLVKFVTTGDLLGYKTFVSVKRMLKPEHMVMSGVPAEMLGLMVRSTSYLNHWNYIITFMGYICNDKYKLQDVANRFNVDQSMISLIRNGKRWQKEADIYKKYKNNPDFTVNYYPIFKL